MSSKSEQSSPEPSDWDWNIFECDTCGSSLAVADGVLGALLPEIDDTYEGVACGDHGPPLPMRRVK